MNTIKRKGSELAENNSNQPVNQANKRIRLDCAHEKPIVCRTSLPILIKDPAKKTPNILKTQPLWITENGFFLLETSIDASMKTVKLKVIAYNAKQKITKEFPLKPPEDAPQINIMPEKITLVHNQKLYLFGWEIDKKNNHVLELDLASGSWGVKPLTIKLEGDISLHTQENGLNKSSTLVVTNLAQNPKSAKKNICLSCLDVENFTLTSIAKAPIKLRQGIRPVLFAPKAVGSPNMALIAGQDIPLFNLDKGVWQKMTDFPRLHVLEEEWSSSENKSALRLFKGPNGKLMGLNLTKISQDLQTQWMGGTMKYPILGCFLDEPKGYVNVLTAPVSSDKPSHSPSLVEIFSLEIGK